MAGSIRARLAGAVAKLKEAGAYDEAAAVEAVTANRGYLLLKNSEEQRTGASPLTLTMTNLLKDALVRAGEEFGVVFSGLAEEAYRLVRDGEWVPPKPPRMPRGMGGGNTVLNLSIDSALREEVQRMLPALSEEAGFKMTESNIALSYFCDQLGVERPNAGDQESLNMRFPKTLVEHWEQQAAAQGVSLRQVVEEGVPSLLDGTWVPDRASYMTVAERGPKTRSWSEDLRQRLWLPIDKELLSGLRSKAAELTAETGQLVYPGAIVRAILTKRLGEPVDE